MEEQKKVGILQLGSNNSLNRKHKLSLVLQPDKENKKPFLSILKKRDNSMIVKKPTMIKKLLKTQKFNNNILTQEIKCFMVCQQKHTSHIFDIKIARRALKKILSNDRLLQSYEIEYSKIQKLVQCVQNKSACSETLLESYENIWKNLIHEYPPTVKMMLNYFGSYLYAVNGQYDLAENQCQKIFDTIVKFKAQQYFIIYLLLKTKLRTNLSQWQQSVKYITKLLYFSWLYCLPDLEIWCYFEFSRAYFFMKEENQANIFRIKSEQNSVESKKSIYREVCVAGLIEEINNIWEGKLDFTFNTSVDSTRLQIPEYQIYKVQEYIKDQRLLKSSIKTIAQQCKIRHVGNLLNRVSQIGHYQLSKNDLTQKNTCFQSGNNFLLTHQSFNKNMNMFFRSKVIRTGVNKPTFYTIQNSQKNWACLKDMLRFILIEMNHYSSYTGWQQRNFKRINIV